MAEWLYRATPKKVELELTRHLAVEDGFICKAAHKTDGKRSDHTKAVGYRDIIHFFFSDPKEEQFELIGSFAVAGPNGHALAPSYAGTITNSKLRKIRPDSPLHKKLESQFGKTDEREGYNVDSVEQVFIGWFVEPSDVPPPENAKDYFTSEAALLRVPDILTTS